MANLWVGVLGPMVVRFGDNEIVIGSAVQRRLLAALTLAGDRPLSVDQLLKLVWGLPHPAAGTLHVALSRLRSELQGVADAEVERVGRVYRLRRASGSADLDLFHALLGEASVAGMPPLRRVALLERACRLWRGPILADLPDDFRQRVGAGAIDDQLTAAARDLGVSARAAGQPSLALPILTELGGRYPLDEALHAELMLTLAAGGRQSEALIRYSDVRRRLAEELGVDAGQQLREAHLQVLRQRAGTGPVDPERQWRGLRPRIRRLIGRVAELADLADLLAEHRLVTVTGPAGGGKTSLALRAAEDFGGDVTVAALAPLSAGARLVFTLGSLLDVAAKEREAAWKRVEHALSAPGQLLLLDNAEHLVEPVAEVVDRLLRACPHLVILVTSRQPLGLVGEVTWALGPLRLPSDAETGDPDVPAVGLFLQRAREALPSGPVTDLAGVARICRRLDGLPLALELAAAQVRAMSVAQIADRLDAGLGLLDATARLGDPRHRTLSAAVDWSFHLLSADEQTVLEQLSVFRGDFSAEVAERVCRCTGDVMTALIGLVSQSLVIARDVADTRRYRLLEAIREYAAGRLAKRAEDELAARGRHLEYWLERADAHRAIPSFGDRVAAARAMATELPDLTTALEAGVRDGRDVEVVETALGLFDVWNVNPGYLVDGGRWLERVESVGDACAPAVRARVRNARARMLAALGDGVGAALLTRTAMEDMAALDTPGRVDLLAGVTLGEWDLLDPRALGHAEELLAQAEEIDGDLRAVSFNTAINVALTWGRTADAERHSTDSVWRGLVAGGWLAFHHSHRAVLAGWSGDAAAARAALASAHRAEPDATSAQHKLNLRLNAAAVLLSLGDAVGARDYLTDQLVRFEREHPEAVSLAALLRIPLAEALRRTDGPHRAMPVISDALEIAHASSLYRASLLSVVVAAALAHDLGDLEGGRAAIAAWDDLRRRLGLPIPLGYLRTVTELGIPPDASLIEPDPGQAWDPELLRRTVGDALRRCRAQLGMLTAVG